MTNCLCGSKKPAAECCDPYLAGTAAPPTAEALMRSRYVAYTRADVDYLARTHAADSPEPFDLEGTRAWATRATFKGLKIVRTEKGAAGDTQGKVEFFARFREGGKSYGHHEVSEFRIGPDGRWAYYAGDGHRHEGDHEHHHHDHGHAPAVETFVRETPKVGRNDPCPCGSGKKWKKCCGAAA